MKYKLSSKLIFSFLIVIFFVVSVAVFVANVTFKEGFKDYIIGIQKQKNDTVINTLENKYKETLDWNKVDLDNIGTNALENSLIIKVTSNDNTILWDAMEHNRGECAELLKKMADNMKKYYHDSDGKYTSKDYPIKVNNLEVGKVTIGYYGPYYFTDNDIVLLESFNRIILITALIAIFIAIGLAIIIAKRTADQIINVTEATKEIATGNYKHRINEKSSTKEIVDLIKAVNNLATMLEKQDKLRKDLTSDIAHEIRTPIATLQSHLEAVKDGVWKLNKDRIDALYEEIIRISKIVNDLDKLNEYDSNTIKLNKANFNIKQLLSKVVNNFSKQAKEKKIKINIIGNDYEIKADKDKITQVFINLISNSLKYTDANGHIDIIIEPLKKKIMITVKDDGIGISEDDLPHIFDRFYRVDKSRTRMTGGCGIGLAIVKNIVEAHEGCIKAESKLNKGTSIIIGLPIK